MEKGLERAVDLLAALASRLGTTVDHLWPILVRQAVYEGVRLLIVGVVLGGVLVVVCWGSVRRAWELGDKKEWSDQEGPMILVAILSGALAAILIPIMLSAGVLRILNPEFYALRFILEAIGGGK